VFFWSRLRCLETQRGRKPVESSGRLLSLECILPVTTAAAAGWPAVAASRHPVTRIP
jgi:hypothetical protein